jgi:hypothetical protein
MPPPLCTTSGPVPDEDCPAAAANTYLGKKGRENLEDNTEGGGSLISHAASHLPQIPSLHSI